MKDFSDKVRSLVGDGTYDIPEEFIINALNWAYNELATRTMTRFLSSLYFFSNIFGTTPPPSPIPAHRVGAMPSVS
jgi:hypothetical protein